jgi:hypothetical protein
VIGSSPTPRRDSASGVFSVNNKLTIASEVLLSERRHTAATKASFVGLETYHHQREVVLDLFFADERADSSKNFISNLGR